MSERKRAAPTACRLAFVVALATASVVALADLQPPRTVIDLQPFHTTQSVAVRSSIEGDGRATLVNLNPTVGVWYVLDVAWKNAPRRTYHLEVARPSGQRLVLDERYPAGIVVVDGSTRQPCDLFSAGSPDRPEQARASGAIFQPVCGGRVYLRNRGVGRHTRLETTTDFLRERVWGGESILELGHQLMGDWNFETSRSGSPCDVVSADERPGPLAARVDAGAAGRTVLSSNLGIRVIGAEAGFVAGAWYPAAASPGVYVSLLQPNQIAASILRGGEKSVNALDAVEASALTYLVAFDLDAFEIGYAGGTENPSVGWSEHMRPQLRDPQQPGPDGIGTVAPLVATGLVNPDDAARTVATFTGGFKRVHSAFLYGNLAAVNRGSHYGFVENGVVLSTLQPGLATIFATVDGRVEMRTWSDADKGLLPRIRFARQNGVPVVELDRQGQTTAPGALVNQWGPGNWSGTEDRKLRTIRGAVALQQIGVKRFLLYAVFSAATPSAMARVFEAYQARYAMPLDMNALEHTYLGLQRRTGQVLVVEHLVKGMEALDHTAGGVVVPRFTGYADNRDFFYVMTRRQEARR